MLSLEDKLAESANIINQRFIMLVQALSGIRALTSISINDADEENLLDKILEVLNQNLDFERCSVFLLRNDDELACIAGKNSTDHNVPDSHLHKQSHIFKIGEGEIGHAAFTRQLYHCRNCKTDSRYLPIIHSQVENNIGSLISVPMVVGEELLGVLNVSHPDPDFFHVWQEHVFNIHADILAQTLYNHRLVKDMSLQVNNRTRELQLSLEETESLKVKYETLSVVDDLTQIHNRRYFFSEMPVALARALRYMQNLNLLIIDLDHFKLINDSYGHEIGDRVLKDVATTLVQQSRKDDILSRLGGEEFAMAVPNTDIDGLRFFARRIQEAVSSHEWKHDGTSFGITVSIGVTTLIHPEGHIQENLMHVNEIIHSMVRDADKALYHSKETGRNRITFFHDMDIGNSLEMPILLEDAKK